MAHNLQSDLFSLSEKIDFESGDISSRYLAALEDAAIVSCDLETSGLDWRSQRIGLVQLYAAGKDVVVLKPRPNSIPRRFVRLIENEDVQKIFHHAMFDLRFIAHHWGARPRNIVCTKIASKILEPQRESHSLATLLQDHLNVMVDKSVQRSNWLSWDLTELQLAYAKADVTSLPDLYKFLSRRLEECDRFELANSCFGHLPTRVALELGDFGDVFAY